MTRSSHKGLSLLLGFALLFSMTGTPALATEGGTGEVGQARVDDLSDAGASAETGGDAQNGIDEAAELLVENAPLAAVTEASQTETVTVGIDQTLQAAFDAQLGSETYETVASLKVVTADGAKLTPADFQFLSGVVVTETADGRYSSVYDAASTVCLKNLTTLDLSEALCQDNAIPPRAFQRNTKIEKIIVPNTLNRTFLHAFSMMTSLTYLGTSEGNLIFPDSMKVMGEGMVYQCGSLAGEVTLPSGLTDIGSSCFYQSGITGDITIPAEINITTNTDINNGVFAPSKGAFSGTGITSLTFKEGVREIPSEFARGCKSLTSVVIPTSVSTIGEYAFDATSLALFPEMTGVTTIGNHAFKDIKTFSNRITLPEGLTTMGTGVFQGVVSTQGLSITGNDLSIPASFLLVNGIDESNIVTGGISGELSIGGGITGIGDSAFSGNSFTGNVAIPGTVKRIGSGAFQYCPITSLTIADGVEEIGSTAFRYSKLEGTLIIPESVSVIGVAAFSYAASLDHVVIENPNITLGQYAFANQQADKDGITCVYLQQVVQNTDWYEGDKVAIAITDGGTFAEDTAFTAGTLATPVKEGFAFAGWYDNPEFSGDAVTDAAADKTYYAKWIDPSTEIASGDCGAVGNESAVTWKLTADGTLTVSGTGAMADFAGNGLRGWHAYASSITAVVVEEGVTYVGDRAFQQLNCKTVSLPSSVTELSDMAFGAMFELESVSIAQGNASYVVDDDVLFTADRTTLVKYPAKKAGSSYVVPDGVEVLGKHAFSYSEALTDLTLPDSLKMIDMYAFSGSAGGSSLAIPDSVTEMGQNAFLNNTAIQSLAIGSGLVEIPAYAFSGTTALRTVSIPENASLKVVGKGAFQNASSLETITLPATIEKIGQEAFRSCSNLVSVAKEGVVFSSLNELEIGNNNCNAFALCSKLESFPLSKDTPLETIHQAFGQCESLKSIVIPDATKTISGAAFLGCTGLEKVEFGAGLETLSGNAFAGCTALKEVRIDGPIKTIGDYAFQTCSALKTVSISADGDLDLGSAFSGTQLVNVLIGSKSGTIKVSSLPGGVATAATFYGSTVDFSSHIFSMNVTIDSPLHTLDLSGAQNITCSNSNGVNPGFIWYLGANPSFSGKGIIYVGGTEAFASLKTALGATTRTYVAAVTNGGTFAEDTAFAAATLAAPVKAGYTFAGWYANSELAGEAVTDVAAGGTYYAKWNEAAIAFEDKTGDSAVTYDGTAQSLAATLEGDADATFSYAYALRTSADGEGTYAEPTSEVPVDAGFYRVTASLEGSDRMATAYLEIAPATLTVSAVKEASKTFDGDGTFPNAGLMLSGVLGTDGVTATATAAVSSASAGSYASATLTDIVLAGTQKSNYALDAPSGPVGVENGKALTIGKAALGMNLSAQAASGTIVGDRVTLTAALTGMVDGYAPAGTITFKDGEAVLVQGVAVVSGTASFVWTSTAGTHDFTAEYTPAISGENYIVDAASLSGYDVAKKNQTGISFDGVVNNALVKTKGEPAFTLAVTGGEAGIAARFESSNSAVAAVDGNGRVTIVSAGTATITARKGNAEYNEVTTMLVLTVKEPAVSIELESAPEGTAIVAKDASSEQIAALNAQIGGAYADDFAGMNIFMADIQLLNISDGSAALGGATFLLGYPAGITAENYTKYSFTVLHLKGGSEPELIVPVPTANGLRITVDGFSPFAVGYKANEPIPISSSVDPGFSTLPSALAPTGDGSLDGLWWVLGSSLLLLVVSAVVLGTKRRRSILDGASDRSAGRSRGSRR